MKPSTRRLAQLYCALLYNANLKGFIGGRIYTGASKALCVPGLNCYSCPGAVGACPLGALQNALAAAHHTAPWYMLGILLLYGVLLGRTVCGWLCPVGLVQELLHKLPTPKVRKSRLTRALSLFKYGVLAVLVVALPLAFGFVRGQALPAFCKFICPAGTFEGAGGLLVNPRNAGSFAQMGALFTNKFVLLVLIALAAVFCYRPFCRFLCPLGAIYGLFNRFALTGVKLDAARCTGCGACVRACPMDVRHGGDRECISCGHCMERCRQGALSLCCGPVTLKGPEGDAPQGRKRAVRILWGLALFVLAFTLLRLGLPAFGAPEEDPPVAASDVPLSAPASPGPDAPPAGSGVGCVLPDFSTDLLGGGEFRLADARGQVVILNLWATFCAPCIEELPYYERLAAAHPDVRILAIHSRAGAKKAEAFLAGKGWDHLLFAADSREKGLYDIVGGSEALPQTLVLNRRSEVIYNAQASVTYEQLEALYRQAAE